MEAHFLGSQSPNWIRLHDHQVFQYAMHSHSQQLFTQFQGINSFFFTRWDFGRSVIQCLSAKVSMTEIISHVDFSQYSSNPGWCDKYLDCCLVKLNCQVTRFLNYTFAGSNFVFGWASSGEVFGNWRAFKHNETGSSSRLNVTEDIQQILREINVEGRALVGKSSKL